MNRHYRVIGYDTEDGHLFVVDIDAPARGIAEVMALAHLHNNVETSKLVDKAARLVTRRVTQGSRPRAFSSTAIFFKRLDRKVWQLCPIDGKEIGRDTGTA
jgi:hypothetical protein